MRRQSVLIPIRGSALVVAVVIALCLALLLPTRSVADDGSGSSGSGSSGGLTVPKRTPAPQHYNPRVGLKTNNPVASRARRTEINRHLLRLINSVPGQERIRIASWNLRSNAFVDALVRAHKRGVSVRVVVSRGNAKPENPNGNVDRLQRALNHNGNKGRARAYRSGLTRCVSACRGPRGIAHTKFYLFSKVGGGARYVVANGSANATDVAARAQWNDLYTLKNRKPIYDEFERIFAQMARDKNVRKRFVSTNFGAITTFFHPYGGPGAVGDPVMRRLGVTSCSGATGGTGVHGKTKIRIAMTSWHGDRGLRIARRLKTMYNRGCNMKIIYAVAGNEVLRVLRRGGRGSVPLRQIAQDPNGDGIYNRYLHMKVMTISGKYRGRGNSRVTFNGSENWSPAAIPSDEAGLRIYSGGVLAAYNRWIEYLFSHPPYQGRPTAGRVAGRAATGESTLDPAQRPPWEVEKIAKENGVDPYALIQVD